jgi:hypothetical protein
VNYSTQNESQRHFEAMLYVLEDPSLDRAAFEARLLDDDRLCEILAEAVELYQLARRSNDDAFVPVYLDTASMRTYTDRPTRSIGYEVTSSSWLGLAVLAGSILMVGYLGWKSFEVFSPTSNSVDSEIAMVNQRPPRTPASADSFNKVVWAWGEVGTGHHEELLTQCIGQFDSEVALASSDLVGESDVPEWLVMATKAIPQEEDEIDSPFEDIDSRTLLQ